MVRFGLLVVSGFAGRNRHGHKLVLCHCDCGSSLVAVEQSLKSGNTKSCGCLKHKAPPNKTHGARNTRAYSVWWNMKTRCERTNSRYFKDYGARGIKICQRWQDFSVFLADMGQPPEGFTLDRIDNDKGYEPGNVRWADRKAQANNRRSNRLIEHDGRTQTLQQWANETGVKRATIAHRLDSGWTEAKALSA